MEGSAPIRTRCVAIVDDDAEVRSLLAAVLSQDGYDIATLANGDALLTHLGKSLSKPGTDALPELIVLDVKMPGLSGLDVLAALRSTHWKAPVIIITAFGDGLTHDRAKRLGAVAVFEKPFEVDDLRRAVQDALASAHESR